MNKRGKNHMMTGIFLMLLVLTGAIVFMVYQQSQQTAVGPSTPGGVVPIQPSLVGKDATLNWIVYDYANSNKGTIVGGLATYLVDQTGAFVEDAKASASTRTGSSVRVGDRITGYAFNTSTTGGYYAIPVTKDIQTQTETMDLVSLRSTVDLDIQLWGNKTNSGKVNGTDLGASESDTFGQFKIKLNQTNRAYNLGGLYCDFIEATNINAYTFASPASLSYGSYSRDGLDTPSNVAIVEGGSIQRTTGDDKMITFAQPIMMLSYDQVIIPGLTVEAKGSNPAETTNCTLVDKAYFRSTKGSSIGYGFETDAASPSDVGVGEFAASRILIEVQ